MGAAGYLPVSCLKVSSRRAPARRVIRYSVFNWRSGTVRPAAWLFL